MSCTYQCQCPRPSSVRLKLSLSARIEKINRVTERQGNRERRERENGDGSESSSVRLAPLLPRAQNEELTDREERGGRENAELFLRGSDSVIQFPIFIAATILKFHFLHIHSSFLEFHTVLFLEKDVIILGRFFQRIYIGSQTSQ